MTSNKTDSDSLKLTSSLTRLDHTNPLLVASATGLTLAAGFTIWSRYLRRIPNADAVTHKHLNGRRLRGVVTRQFPPVPPATAFFSSSSDLKDQTIHVRLAGVDAPELAHFGQPAQPFSAEALDKLTELVHKRVVHVHLYRKDRYGRVVGMAYVRRPPWPWRVNVSEQMLKAGLATVYTQGGAEYAGLLSRFEKLEAIAQHRKVGMWQQSKSTYESPADASEATRFLKATSWRLDSAIDAFFGDPAAMASASKNRGPPPATAAMTRNLEQMWQRYADPSNPTETAIDGTILYCQDLEVEPEDVVMLAVAYMTKAPTMGRFAKQGWIEGWKDARKDSIATQRQHIETLRDSLRQSDYYRRMYNFTFDYAKTEGQKSLQLDTASDLWNLLIPLDPSSDFPVEHLQWWQEFLVGRGSKAVSRDTWNLFLEFVRTIDSRFEQHDEEAAWPSLIDDFVEHARAKLSSE
ncbi:Scaffold-type E3 ligase [Microbotryomycetes sp. JL221]|nr:Scaffold-type E3 ligase [Microbotryomycetes sp. JL221]